MLRDVMTPVLLLVVVLIGQQCSGMKIIQGFAVEIFADVFTKVGHLCFYQGEGLNLKTYHPQGSTTENWHHLLKKELLRQHKNKLSCAGQQFQPISHEQISPLTNCTLSDFNFGCLRNLCNLQNVVLS